MEKRKLRKLILFIAFLAFLVVVYFLARIYYPKEIQRLPFYAVLLLVDFYLWTSIRKKLKKAKPVTRKVLTVLYWFPLPLFLATTTLGMVLPIIKWQPALFTYIMGVVIMVYFSKLFVVVFLLLADIIKIAHFTFKFIRSKKRKIPFNQAAEKISRARFLENIGLAGGGILLSGMVVGVVKWAYDFKIRRETIHLPHLPGSFAGFRIVQISDLHLGSWASARPLQEAVEMVNSLDPDLVVFTGDLVNFTTDEALKFKKELVQIKAKHGIFAILGNHDYGDYINWPSPEAKQQNMNRLYKFYDQLGWKLLRNENQFVRKGQDQISLVGVENWGIYDRFPKYGDLEKALIGTDDSPVKILLSHDPTHWEYKVSVDYPEIDLTLSGHTHGFQFGVEFKNFKWSLAQLMYKYWAGLYSANSRPRTQYLYVNRGLGMIGYPGRVGILPEITEITLET